ncbi:hypothetical protein [Dysgonomonas sp. 520]|uniref:hypothetical protein n=1 Tax=Dysgonomonas sp. 520 TaxID=2302931 RepID=UPI0013D11D78|nr:hypothetical protein [Dysgonomonas sp. 520]
METNFIEVVQSVILPIVTIVLGYFGWRANADKNKLQAELKSLEHSNVSKEIENQNSWLDLYKKLHNDQAERMAQMEGEIQKLKNTIKNFEYAFKKAHSCRFYDVCPVRSELQKFENNNGKRTRRKPSTNRPRDSTDRENSEGDNIAPIDNENDSES